MIISKIKKKIKNINFLCIGACHSDNILKLKNEHKLFRTNPVSYDSQLGGVASNIANNIRLFNKNVILFSLSGPTILKKKLNNNKIKFKKISKINNDGFYTAILDNNGKLILGLAYNNTYEKLKSINLNIINNSIKKNSCLILDLCFNEYLTSKIIKYYYKKNINIMIAGTSSFKIYRIKKSLKMITSLCLNEEEILKLTNKKTINNSINYILNKNPNISLVITRANKSVIMIIKKIKYKGMVPKIDIKNENGAGDAFAAMFFCAIHAKFSPNLILSLSICLGCMKAMDYKYKNINKFNNKFQTLLKNIKIIKYE